MLDAKAENTRRAYRSDWRTFERWCEGHGLEALPASGDTVALYLAARADAGARVSTLSRALASISEAHRAGGHPVPREASAVKAVLQGIRREQGTAPHQKSPLLLLELKAMLEQISADTLKGCRDRALLLVGFAAALRRSELVGLQLEDLRFTSRGLELLIRRSKTDQEGEGQRIGIPHGYHPETCPVRALSAWLQRSGIHAGRVFRGINRHGQLGDALTDRSVALLIKAAAQKAGLPAADYSGHSLRAGLATQAAISGKGERTIMAQTRHRSPTMVRRYIRDSDLWRDNAADGIGL
jgi:site-specific recombinase XerD